MSGRELARRLGVSHNYVAMRFRHEASFTVHDIGRIADALGVDAATFLAQVEINDRANVTDISSRRDVGAVEEAELRREGPSAANTDTSAGEEEPEAP